MYNIRVSCRLCRICLSLICDCRVLVIIECEVWKLTYVPAICSGGSSSACEHRRMKFDYDININVILTDVLYVLELKENLLSTTMLMLKGLKIVQENDTITAYSKQGGTIIAVTV